MSRENVAALRRGYAAFNEGADELLVELLHPEFTYHAREELPGGGSYQRPAFIRRLKEVREMFRDARIEPEEFLSSGEHVVVAVHARGLGRASEAVVEGRLFHVWTFENARARNLRVYSDRAEALEAVGLRE